MITEEPAQVAAGPPAFDLLPAVPRYVSVEPWRRTRWAEFLNAYLGKGGDEAALALCSRRHSW